MHLQCVMPVNRPGDSGGGTGGMAPGRGKTCYQCGSPDHLANFHRRPVTSTPASAAGRVEPRSTLRSSSARPPPSPARVNQCALTRDRPTSPLVESPTYRIGIPDKRPPGQNATKLVFLWRNLKSPDCVFFYSRAVEK